MKKTLIIFLLIILPFVIWARPESDAKAYVVICGDNNQIIYSKNMEQVLPMASTTKIMTAVVYLENGNTEKDIVYTKNASRTPFGNMHFPLGTSLSSRDALSCMLLTSSNDMAVAVAESFTDRKNFIDLMNKKAKELGMTKTNYMNVHGLDTKNHYSTCYDLAILGSYAMKNNTFRSIMKKTANVTLNINGTPKNKVIQSTFKDFYSFPGACGIKTGTTTGAGNCFVGYVERNGVPIITAVLGDNKAVEETKSIVNYTFKHCDYRIILNPQDIYYVTVNKLRIPVRVGGVVKVFGDPDEMNVKYDIQSKVRLPILKNSLAGYISVYDGGKFLCKKPLYSNETHIASKGEIWFLVMIVLVMAGAFGWSEKEKIGVWCQKILNIFAD